MSDAPFDSDWAVDALIVTAIPLEFDAVLEVNEGAEPGSKWEIGRSPSGLERTARRNFVGKDDRALRVAVVQSTLMGGVAAVMAVGALLGGVLGGKLAGKVKPSTLRWTVVTIGVIVSIIYFVRG